MKKIRKFDQYKDQADFEKELEDAMTKRLNIAYMNQILQDQVMDFINDFDVPDFAEKVNKFVDSLLEGDMDSFLESLEKSKESRDDLDEETSKRYISLVDRILDYFSSDSKG